MVPPRALFLAPNFAVHLGFMGQLNLLNEDRVVLHPYGGTSLWPKSRKTLGWEEWSAFLAFILSWLLAKLEFWSQTEAQVELEGLDVTITTLPNNDS